MVVCSYDALSSSCSVSLRTVIFIGYAAFAGMYPDLIVHCWLYVCIKFRSLISFSFYSSFCFVDNYNLVSVVVPTSLVAISDAAFSYCSALLTIIIPT